MGQKANGNDGANAVRPRGKSKTGALLDILNEHADEHAAKEGAAAVASDPEHVSEQSGEHPIPASPRGDTLDETISRINTMAANLGGAAWDIGRELAALRDGGVWQARYETFDDLLTSAEINVARQTAYKFVAVSEKFSREEVARFGWTKFALALQAPEEVQPEIVGAIEHGASKREVEALVKDAKADEEQERVDEEGDDENPPQRAGEVEAKISRPRKRRTGPRFSARRELDRAAFEGAELLSEIRTLLRVKRNGDIIPELKILLSLLGLVTDAPANNAPIPIRSKNTDLATYQANQRRLGQPT